MERAEKIRQAVLANIARDPEKHRQNSARGGSAKVPKGFAKIDKERHIELSRKGGLKKS